MTSNPWPPPDGMPDWAPPSGPASELAEPVAAPSDPQGTGASGWAPPQGPAPEVTAPDVVRPVPTQGTAPAGKVQERPHPLTGVAKSWIALVGLVFVGGREFLENGMEGIRELGPFMWVLGGVALLFVLMGLVAGLIQWRTTIFVADDDEFRIERNFLSRNSSRISYGKIQSVDIERSLVARILGLASVKIDVGGAGGQKLEYLGVARAESLRDHLLHRMRALAVHSPSRSTAGVPAGSDDPETTAAGPGYPTEPDAPVVLEQVIEMRPPTLLLGVFVSGLLPWLIGGIGFIIFSITLGGGFSIAALGGIVFGLGGYLWSQLANNWDFTLTRVPDGLHIRRGLFTKVSKSLKTDRIQAVSIHQDYLQRLTGLYRVRVTVLGFGGLEDGGQTADLVLPYGYWDDVRRVLGAFWPGINLETIELHGQPDRARWLTPLGFKRHLWGADEQTLVAHHGWLDHTISLVPHRRMQSIGINQGPLQRRLDLATVNIHTTDGPVNLQVYHLDAVEARSFFDMQVERARAARDTPGEPSYLTALPAPEATARIPSPHAWPAPTGAETASPEPQAPSDGAAPVDDVTPPSGPDFEQPPGPYGHGAGPSRG